MIQLYVDDVLTYDSRWEKDEFLTLKAKTALNKGGVATIGLPPGHPAYSKFKPYKSIVLIKNNSQVKFRGRALPPSDDYYNQRTILCEGELCFLRDAICRPYLYQDSPAAIFTAVLGIYNSQADAERQFLIGDITVTDSNDYIRLESESAETVLDTVNKLIERCGGYVVFTTNRDGDRVINWYADADLWLLPSSIQSIEFGSNLLDFTRDSTSNEELATAILPYGAKDQETDKRVTIESVNGGVDYIVDEDARALRGFILATQTWDDVTEPANLLKKAQEWLATKRNIISSLRLSALDLSYLDYRLGSFMVGNMIYVHSDPHYLDEEFLLTELEEDFLDPKNGEIVLGKSTQSLTVAAVAGDDYSISEMHAVVYSLRADYQAGIAQAVEATEKTLISHIDQTGESIRTEVAQQYATNEQLTESVGTAMTQTSEQFLFEFETLKSTVSEHDVESRLHFEEIYKYISFEDGNLTLGSGSSAITLTLENDLIIFKKNGAQFGWWDGVDFHTGNIVVEVNERAQFGDFAFVPRSNGSLSFLKIR